VIAPGSTERDSHSNSAQPCPQAKRAVNVDNFVVATEEPIVSVVYELELVPVVLLQQGFARRPVVSEPRRRAKRSLLVRRRFERSNMSMSSASFPRRKV